MAMSNGKSEAASAANAILKVQDEVTMLRTKLMELTASGHGNQSLSSTARFSPILRQLNDAILQTEQNIGREAERLAIAHQEHVTVLPPLSHAATIMNPQLTRSDHRLAIKSRPRKTRAIASTSLVDTSLSLGETLKLRRDQQALANPRSVRHHAAVKDRFGELAAPKQTRVVTKATKQPQKQHHGQLKTLSKKQRADPQLAPPPITREDARRGLLSLIERGLIPPATDVVLTPAPMHQKRLHPKLHKTKKAAAVMDEMEASAGGAFVSGVKMRTAVSIFESAVDLTASTLDMPVQPVSSVLSLPDDVDQEQLAGEVGRSELDGDDDYSDDFAAPSTTEEADTLSVPAAPQTSPQQPQQQRQQAESSSSTRYSDVVSATRKVQLAEVSVEFDASTQQSNELPTTPPCTKQTPRRIKVIAIQHGVTVKSSPDYRDFRRQHTKHWPRILGVLRDFEGILATYSIPLAFVDIQKVLALAKKYSLEARPSQDQLLDSCVNGSDVEALIMQTGRSFTCPKGQELAAKKIQAVWRMHIARSQWREYRRRKWAAGVLCMAWMLNLKYRALHHDMDEARLQRLEAFYSRQEKLSQRWHQIKNASHKVLHLPSLGYTPEVRQSLSEFNLLQNIQLGRLADVVDPLKDVLYVSPIEFDDHMTDYCANLLKAGNHYAQQIIKQFEESDMSRSSSRSSQLSAVTPGMFARHSLRPDSGSEARPKSATVPADVMFRFRKKTGREPHPGISTHRGFEARDDDDDNGGGGGVGEGEESELAESRMTQEQLERVAVEETRKIKAQFTRPPWDRFTVVTPALLKVFDMHNLPLASSLVYSTRTMTRLRNLAVGLDGYIVPGVVSDVDLQVAEFLDMPVLSPEPTVVQQLSSKSGARSVFLEARVECAPGKKNMSNESQLVRHLSQLIVDNLHITRWLLKINDEVNARGIAVLEIEQTLPCREWLLREASRFGDKWSRRWAQEQALNRLELELPDVIHQHLEPVSSKLYTSSEQFLNAACSQGFVLEASPASSSVTTVTADILIEPDASVHLLCTTDQIHSSPYHCDGYSMPQTSIEPSALHDTCQKIGGLLAKRKGVMGYCSMDFVTFLDARTNEQVVWATDLKFRYGNSLALAGLSMFMSASAFDPHTGCVRVKQAVAASEVDITGGGDRVKLVASDNTPLRFSVMSNTLRNSNMVLTRFEVFFQMCKGRKIGFKMEDGTGTVFQLTDSVKRHALGMICISDTLPGALKMFARNLNVIHQEVAPKGRNGRQNFTVIQDALDTIIADTEMNEEELEDSTTDLEQQEGAQDQ